jgi:hypothetical protein
VVRKRLLPEQIPILWKVKCSRERDEMDSHLEYFRSMNSLFCKKILKGGMGLCLLSLLSYLRADRILEWRFHWIDHSWMDGIIVEILGFVVSGIVWRRWMSLSGVGN